MIFTYGGYHGPDISRYQGDPRYNQFVDFSKMALLADFVIIKVGQLDYADPAFRVNWAGAKAAGISRGGYFFLDGRGSGSSQARLFWELVRDDPPEGPLVVDYEVGSGTDWHRVYDFLATLMVLSGFPVERLWVYTGYYFWNSYSPRLEYQKNWFRQFGLWLAWYANDATVVRVPAPWSSVVLWQKGTTVVWGPDYGVHSLELDWNLFNGRDLTRYFDAAVPTPIKRPFTLNVQGYAPFTGTLE